MCQTRLNLIPLLGVFFLGHAPRTAWGMIYGADKRMEIWEADASERELARSVAALVEEEQLPPSPGGRSLIPS